jgi:hypothetical protein
MPFQTPPVTIQSAQYRLAHYLETEIQHLEQERDRMQAQITYRYDLLKEIR